MLPPSLEQEGGGGLEQRCPVPDVSEHAKVWRFALVLTEEASVQKLTLYTVVQTV